jgi:hypothetical protein
VRAAVMQIPLAWKRADGPGGGGHRPVTSRGEQALGHESATLALGVSPSSLTKTPLLRAHTPEATRQKRGRQACCGQHGSLHG